MSRHEPVESPDGTSDPCVREGETHPWHEHDAIVQSGSRESAGTQQTEITNVLADEDSTLVSSDGQQIRVTESAQGWSLRCRHDIVALASELLGDRRREVLVEQQPHARASAMRRVARSSSSAYLALLSIQWSISSG
jgi:hypothetical protein